MAETILLNEIILEEIKGQPSPSHFFFAGINFQNLYMALKRAFVFLQTACISCLCNHRNRTVSPKQVLTVLKCTQQPYGCLQHTQRL